MVDTSKVAIIFAVNQKHAAFIVKCFRERYPEHASGFIETIHNGISHAQSLITAFCDKEVENNPQIAVSISPSLRLNYSY